MSLIDKLTPEQEAKFSFYVDKWKKIGLCTEKANRREAEKQLMWLINTVAGFGIYLASNGDTVVSNGIADRLREINDQQSEYLREVE